MISIHDSVQVSKVRVRNWQKYLNMDKAVPDAGEDEILDIITVDLGEGLQVDIKLVNNASGPYIDAVMFDEGNECITLEPVYHLIGDYCFKYKSTKYIINVKEKICRTSSKKKETKLINLSGL